MKIFVVLYLSAMAYIKYDSGLNTDFNPSTAGFLCQNSYSLEQTTSFNGQFQNIPQVFIQLNWVDIAKGNTEYRLSITSITLTNFMVKIFCPSSTRTHTLKFQWYAIDDQRVQVINAFNIDNPTISKNYQHLNANAEQGMLFPISLSYVGPLDFVIQISSITKTDVTIEISNPSGKFVNLKQIGYQIVLGTSEIFTTLGLQTVTGTSYTSENYNLLTNKWFLTPIIGVNYPDDYYLQFRWTYTYTASTVSCKIDSWDRLVKHTHQKVWMSYVINTQYLPLYCVTIRISQKIDLEAINRSTIYSEIPQINGVFNQIGTFTTIIDKSISPLTINVIVKCSQGKKITSKFNKCNNCSPQMFYTFTHNCHNQINQISYFPRYISSISAHQELEIIISASRIQLNQIKSKKIISVYSNFLYGISCNLQLDQGSYKYFRY